MSDLQIAWGPKMAALNPKRQGFVCALFDCPTQKGRLLWAAKVAGYGTSTSSNDSLCAIASRLCADERVRDAIAEEGYRRLRVLSPGAISALERIIGDPKNKNHVRGISMVLERADPVTTNTNVTVSHTDPVPPLAIEKALKRIEELALRAGLVSPPKIIEGTAVAEVQE